MNKHDFVAHINTRRRGKMKVLERLAAEFAFDAHNGQFRKFNYEPYICHPAEVASIVAQVSNDVEALAAAWLHDVVEDCGVSFATIGDQFGPRVLNFVHYLTSPSQIDPEKKKLSRAVRKDLDARHMLEAPVEAKTVKCADILSNINSLVYNDPDFARTWIQEKAQAMKYLEGADVNLFMLTKNNILFSKSYLNII